VEAIARNPNGARALRGKQVGNADAVAGYQIVISVTAGPWTEWHMLSPCRNQRETNDEQARREAGTEIAREV
jgi:hypothetical protein